MGSNMRELSREITLGGSVTCTIDAFPDECPICHHHINPRLIASEVFDPPRKEGVAEGSGLDADMFFRCPSLQCRHTFIGSYSGTSESKSGGVHHLILRNVGPRQPRPYAATEEVRTLSPAFVEIAQQAQAAEDLGLIQVAGVGLRKALEFLIKDYCIDLHPTRIEDIKKSFLGGCIKEYIADSNVKQCATRATWLGNDETHYERRWIDRDLKDLKTLIILTMNWITNEIVTRRYLAQMKGDAK